MTVSSRQEVVWRSLEIKMFVYKNVLERLTLEGGKVCASWKQANEGDWYFPKTAYWWLSAVKVPDLRIYGAPVQFSSWMKTWFQASTRNKAGV